MNLNQVTVAVTDVERSIGFYQSLGNRLIVKALPKYARFECPEGDATFSIHKVDEMAKDPQTIIYFEVAELDSKVNKLVEEGILFDELPEDRTWLWREARLRDPDGNRLILYYAGDNRKNPPWRISSLAC
ncbi:MAG TPA: VOC family protein [Chitinophagaceae bacterium]|nr:VOC family protein [Chitinophagaceae bacterium]